MWIYIAHNILKTSSALVILAKTEHDCLKKLLKTVRTTRRISEPARQRVPDRRTGDRKRPTARLATLQDPLTSSFRLE